MNYSDIMNAFEPKMLNIANLDLLANAISRTNILVYGEIHGIKENAHIIYTLAHQLKIEVIAVEASPSIKVFIDSASRDEYDFSQIDTNTFDSSVISIEVAKTLATLIKENTIQEIIYIDSYFDDLIQEDMDDQDSPQKRERVLADNILALDTNKRTLCILGQWHTQPEPAQLESGGVHLSALYRVRQQLPTTPFSHNMYRFGHLYNDGRTINIPMNNDIPEEYTVKKQSQIDFDLCIPMATKIQLPSIDTNLPHNKPNHRS